MAVPSLRLACLLLGMLVCQVTPDLGVELGRRSDDTSPLELVVNRLSQDLAKLTAEVTGLKTQLATLEQPVAFTARFSDWDQQGLGHGQTLKFDDVIYNAGGGYSASTGLFTAPSSGTYAFFVEAMVHEDDDSVELAILKDKAFLGTAFAATASYYASTSTMVTAHLGQGEAVHVEIIQGSMLQGGRHTSFTGMKLSPL